MAAGDRHAKCLCQSTEGKAEILWKGSFVVEQMTSLTLMRHVSAVQTWMAPFLAFGFLSPLLFFLSFFFFFASQARSQLKECKWVEGLHRQEGI